MTRKLDYLLQEWAQGCVTDMGKSGYSGINIIEKILRDPGISTKGSRHRVLWWPRNRKMARMSKAMHQIPKRRQVCLIVEYGGIVNDDNGQLLTKKDIRAHFGLKCKDFDIYVKKSRKRLREILRGYGEIKK